MKQLTRALSDSGQRGSSSTANLVTPTFSGPGRQTMNTFQNAGSAGVRDLPPYRSMLVVDMKDYSGAPGRQHGHLNALIPEIMQSAFTRCGLEELWAETTFADSTGDGYAIGLPAERLPFLLNPYLGALQAELAGRSQMLAAAGFEPIRMRVSVTVGPVTDSGQGSVSDGAGDARVELHRLLDSKPVRDLLARSGDITRVAAIVSSRAYEDAVAAGYSDEPKDLYVEAPVQVKSYQGRAYLRVPVPSGELLTHGFGKPADGSTATATTPAEPGPAEAAPPAVQVTDNTRYRRGGVGSIGTSTGPIITDSSGPTHLGTGHLYLDGRSDRETPQ
ncbi:hypothetical protein AB0P21_36840 [Kribbella sp. NPDC056861]|uniref:hypothetical protein n=1 Tax=Kribbella sp. NPDC056861 TaxID=3154857 RepID=UPI003431D601